MSLPAPPAGITRIRLIHTSGTSQFGFGLYTKQATATPPTSAELDTFAGVAATSWSANAMPNVNSLVTLAEVIAEYFDGSGGTVVGSAIPLTVGGGSGSPLPLSNCIVASWAITAAYRGGKPRSYMSGLMIGDLDGSNRVWKSATVSNWLDTFQDLKEDIEAATLAGEAVTVGELSFFEDALERGGTPPPVQRSTPLFRPFTSVRVKPSIGTQRRRIQN